MHHGEELFNFENNNQIKLSFGKFISEKLVEIEANHYDKFDDYLEMII